MLPLDLYELCVQTPRTVVAMLRAAHGQLPLVLREDFCGTAAVSRRWVAEGLARGELARAVAADLDPPTIAHARAAASREGLAERIEFHTLDSIRADVETTDDADVVYVGNFSLAEIHDEDLLIAYLKRSRRRLAMGNHGFGGGVFVCDMTGGPAAYRPLELTREHRTRAHETVRYLWRHEAGDASTHRVRNSISFHVTAADGSTIDLHRAFVYEWRLWPLDTLEHAFLRAGFKSFHLFPHVGLAPGQPATPIRPADLPLDWVCYVVGRTA
ncbi:MAG: class I SAM-dependent methyltransferase [Leptolyngbya sp. PLA1]|nr:class I SAM-dependent methyltransferase [Leptolyngbya sp. PLA1]